MKRVLLLGLAAVVIAALAAVVGYSIARPSGSRPTQAYPVNSLNLTYGEIGQEPSPDLVLVTTRDGVEGYAFAIQINGRPRTDPGQDSMPSDREVPVYNRDLTEVLGYMDVN